MFSIDLVFVRFCVRYRELVVLATCSRSPEGRFGFLSHRLEVR